MTADHNSEEFLERIQKLSPRRLMLLAAELQRRLAAREKGVEPIAVTGMACRIPGGVNTPEGFWTLLANSEDAIEVVPADRWEVESFYDEHIGAPGKTNTKWGGFVRGIDLFDAAFFGIAPREAVAMDPQQRILLETAWEALENACIRADLLAGSTTGVFVGISTGDYGQLAEQYDDVLGNAYAGTGLARSVAAGRISYYLGLKGPNLAVDTSCSSSAVAIHLACQSLRNKECCIALAGGVNAILSPRITIMLSQAHMMAPDGRCKAFSQSADGFVRSEGAGMVVLKRLSDARAEGDRIIGIIRGSAINHDGRSNGLAAPNGPSQEAVIRAALAQAELRPLDVDYIETHGTGTVLGDAIELGALANVFCEKREHGRELAIGSVKTNIGHLEAAAGVAGFIKVLLAFQNERLPAHLHVERGEKSEALHRLPFWLPDGKREWAALDRPRRAGVSSLGFSGTNAHIVLEEAPAIQVLPLEVRSTELLTVSAKDPQALAALCMRYAEHLEMNKRISLADFAFSLSAGRSHFQHRVSFIARTLEEATSILRRLGAENLDKEPEYRFAAGYEPPAIGFLFTGQGSQFPAMGKQLYAASDVFRDAVDRCDSILCECLHQTLADILCGSASVPPETVHETSWTQPVLFAFEYALAQVWASWGVRPAVLLGHSLGEYVAACLAGIISLETALTLAYERGRLMGSLPHEGGMIAARVGAEEAEELIRPLPRISIAAINGPRSIVFSGESAQLAELRALLDGKGIASSTLAVSHAFHSDLMNPILDPFERFCAGKDFSAPTLPFVSNVTGRLHSPDLVIDSRYWRRHLRGTVRFAEGLSALAALKPAALVEIGPDAVLLGMAKPSVDPSIVAVPSVRRGMDVWQTLNEGLRQLSLLGVKIDWDQVYLRRACRKLALPTYPFQRQRYWLSGPARSSTALPAPSLHAAAHTVVDPQLYVVEYEGLPDNARSVRLNSEQLAEAANASIEAAGRDDAMVKLSREYSELIPRMDRLCALYILEMLRRIGTEPVSGVRLRAVRQIGDKHHRLFEWLLRILEQEGVLRRDGDGFIFERVPLIDLPSEEARLFDAYPQFASEFALLHRASYLADVLEGRIPGIEVLFPQGSFHLAESIYRDSPAAQILNRTLAALVRDAANGLMHEGNIRILEVGAGTGSATEQILPSLQHEGVEYVFTDISAAFFASAQQKFTQYPFVKYATLDLEKTEVGNEDFSESFDIVIASNVLHATTDVRQCLQNVRRLLRPGGFLIALEGTAIYRSAIVTLGMIDGWWRFADAPLRKDYPLLDGEQWLQLLAEEGFSAAATSSEGPVGILSQRQIILTAEKGGAARENVRAPEVALLNEGGCDSGLASLLSQCGVATYHMPAGENGEAGVPAIGQNLAERLQGVLARTPKVRLALLETSHNLVDESTPERALDEASAVIEAVKTLVSQPPPVCPVWLVTHGALLPDEDAAVNLSSSVLDGIVKSACMEHPELQIKQVDLPLRPGLEDVQTLSRLIREGTRERTLVVRGQRIAVPRLKVLPQEHKIQSVQIRANSGAAYLITGGYGILGMHTAQWLAKLGADCIYLAGRNEPKAAAREEIGKLRAQGILVHEQLADVSKHEDISRLFAVIARSGRELRGIIHAAGAIENEPLTKQNRETLRRAFAPKVQGAWLLHEASKKMALDFFVLFGSGASVLGLQGSANYAAANGFLDGLARFRRQQGWPATSIAWGQWTEVGIAGFVAREGRSAKFGLLSFPPERGIELLEQAIQIGRAEVAPLAMDWSVYLAPGNAQSKWPFFEPMAQQALKPGTEPVPKPRPVATLYATPTEQRAAAIRDYLKKAAVRVLGLETAFALRDDQPLSELGLDSLMALELRNDLQQSSGVLLPANFFFEYGTVRKAAEYLIESMNNGPGHVPDEPCPSEYEEIEL